MDVFAALAIEWARLASTAKAHDALSGWALRAPDLAGFTTPADVVATIARLGDPARSCALLAELLAIADDDLAARAVLQAVVPGLRHTVSRRWQNARRSGGPWTDPSEIAVDAVSATWEIIHAHRGERHQRPAAVIIRPVERRLRQTHDQWRRDARRTTTLDAVPVDPSRSGTAAAYSAEHQAATTIRDAVLMGVIRPTAAVVIYSTGVLGHSMAEVEHALALPRGSGYRSATRGRSALRKWYDDSPATPLSRSDLSPRTAQAVEGPLVGPDRVQHRLSPPEQFQTQRHEPDRDRTVPLSRRHASPPPTRLDGVPAVVGQNGTTPAGGQCLVENGR